MVRGPSVLSRLRSRRDARTVARGKTTTPYVHCGWCTIAIRTGRKGGEDNIVGERTHVTILDATRLHYTHTQADRAMRLQ